MDVTLPADLTKQVEQELATGQYRSRDELIEKAVRHFFDARQRGRQRLDALRRIGRVNSHVLSSALILKRRVGLVSTP